MKNIKIILCVIVMSIILITPVISKAGLYATKGGTPMVEETLDDAFLKVRMMETQYGTLGKNAIVDSNYIETTSNGIDCHLAKNTEWGTAAMLCASEFGSLSSDENGRSISGNNTGIIRIRQRRF